MRRAIKTAVERMDEAERIGKTVKWLEGRVPNPTEIKSSVPPDLMDMQWKVHTANLLTEIVNCSRQPILEKPISIFGKLLAAVGQRAAELNDPKLNALMCRLTIYTIADPESPDYDAARLKEIMEAGR